MKTLQPTLKRGRDVWDKINMPESEFRRRVKHLRNRMKKEGLDLLLLYGRGADQYANPAYLSNFLIKLPRAALVALPAEGEVTLIVEGFPRDQPAIKKVTWIEDVRSCREMSKGCAEYLQNQKLTGSKLGVVGLKQLMPFHQYRELYDSLKKAEVIEADHLLEAARLVKSDREQDQIRRASRIISRALEFVTSSVFPELNERVLEASIDHLCRLEGAEDIRILIGRPSEPEWAFRPAENVAIQVKSPIIVYMAVAFERYWSEAIRTFTCEASGFTLYQPDEADNLYKQLIGQMIPGKPISQLYDDLLAKFTELSLEWIPRYGLGQGIGLSPAEGPVLSRENSGELVKDTCQTLPILVKDGKDNELMMGNTLLVLEDGVEILTV